MNRSSTARVRLLAVEGDTAARRTDRLAVEEPLEIRAAGPGQQAVRVAVTMRTPGDDFALAAGFLHGEGLIGAGDVHTIRYCDDIELPEQQYNVVTVNLRRPFDDGGLQRNFYATSSCGVCGKASIDQIEITCAPIPEGFAVPAALLGTLPNTLRERQAVFERTGGLHAAGLFDGDGKLLDLREDVGRHNALDKLIGTRLLAERVPLSDTILLVSGRASFELVQKAAAAGIPLMCAISAPSSLAVEAADRLGVTLVGFLRDDRLNVYAHPGRVLVGAPA
ncbi:MAG: FdhD protein [Gaiellaceae bacterium]|nr:FdhD protein [Gaiellaceae bacterium]